MENATKALMIAGAVLIAILIISLGIGIFNSSAEQVENADLTEYQIQTFNDKFRKYEGTSKTGAEVNALDPHIKSFTASIRTLTNVMPDLTEELTSLTKAAG